MKNCENSKTDIQKFYSGKCILITGATGFIGKLIIERLCLLCPDVDTIYIMVRTKKEKSPENRLKEFLNNVVFSKLPEGWKNKIVAIEGDLQEPEMGMKIDDRLLLINRVNIVFHSAATVRFDELLKKAFRINVVGTMDVVKLCKQMKNLRAFVHVSTSFSNCYENSLAEERIYKSNISFEDIAKLSTISDEGLLEIAKPKFLNKWPNSYSFTKALAENVVHEGCKDLPFVIFRPALVMGTSGKHSAPGFIDNLFGPSALFIGVGLGIMRILHIGKDNKTYMLPGDYCANAIITSAWDVDKRICDTPFIINYLPPDENNIKWDEFLKQLLVGGCNTPSSNALWWPSMTLISCKYDFHLRKIFLHLIPAIFVDFCMYISGKEPRLLDVHRKIEKFFDILSVYMRKNFSFQVEQMPKLISRMSTKDRELFYCDLSLLDWKNYSPTIIYGVRYYLMKEDPATIPQSRKRLKKLKYAHYTLITIVIMLFVLYFYTWLKF